MAQVRRIAAEVFGWPRLTDEQMRAMEHVMAGDDVLVVLPTGAGKSAIYQVPALLLDGPTVVVSPLIALQRDQIAGLADAGAPAGVAVNSAQSAAANRRAWDAVARGDAEYVFLSPEQLADDSVVAALAAARPSLFVVDEAHCVSAWGHDFRPDYRRLGEVIERLGHPRVLAMTATATPAVRADIAERLGLREPVEVLGGFDRPDLHLAVHRFQSDADKRRAVLRHVLEQEGPGLLYVSTRKDTAYYADRLAADGVSVAAYHAGMAASARRETQQCFLDDEVRVMVATSAFGMGIDKPGLRFVVHASVPASPDAYYQEIGRVGRDGEPASVVLCYRPEDLHLQRFLTTVRSHPDDLRAVLRVLRRHRGPMGRARLKAALDLPDRRRARAVNQLEQAGAVRVVAGRLVATLDPRAAVRRAEELSDARQRLVRSQIEMLRGYAETTACRRGALLGYFGEPAADRCDHCDNCDRGDRGAAATPPPAADTGFVAHDRVRHTEWSDGTVMQIEHDRLTVLFDLHGYKTLDLAVLRDNDLLRPVG